LIMSGRVTFQLHNHVWCVNISPTGKSPRWEQCDASHK
jgi:hypothetical protein